MEWILTIVITLIAWIIYKITWTEKNEKEYREFIKRRDMERASNNVFVDYSDAMDEREKWIKDIDNRYKNREV